MTTPQHLTTDICIVGAGPGGCSSALHLSYLGIPSVLIDRARFPRDKICGDALSGKVPTVLNRLDPAILRRFKQIADGQTDVWGIQFVAPNGREVNVPFKSNFDKAAEPSPGYVSKRVVFDNFLIEEVQRRDNIDLHLETDIQAFERTEGGYRVTSKDGSLVVDCRLLLDASGANSRFSRHHAGLEKDNAHHAGAVRAYYRNVKGMHHDNFIELHFLKELAPGYFWIFPLPNNQANVGLGLRTDYISKRKLNLKQTLLDLLATHPKLKGRFDEAELISKIVGFPLPLGSKKRVLSGDNYLLVGDSGHLIDPLTGEGIGNALYAGYIAAELAEKCLAENDFSAERLRAYDVRVARVIGQEMRLSYRMQQMLRYPWLANTLGNIIGSNMGVIDALSHMYNDLDLRKQVVNPAFWVKQLFAKRA